MRATCVALVALLAACGDMVEDLGAGQPERAPVTEVQPPAAEDLEAARECAPTAVTEPTPTPDERTPDERTLTVRIAGTREYPTVRGTLELRPAGQHVEVLADLQGLPPGKHAVHVHELGDCTDPKGMSMGGHLDLSALQDASTGAGATPAPAEGATPDTVPPTAVPPPPTPNVLGHLGDLESKDLEPTRYTAVIQGLSPENLRTLIGRAVAIHERADDPTKPDGGAGAAIACGVVGVPRPGAPPEG